MQFEDVVENDVHCVLLLSCQVEGMEVRGEGSITQSAVLWKLPTGCNTATRFGSRPRVRCEHILNDSGTCIVCINAPAVLGYVASGANSNVSHLNNVINCVWVARRRPNVHWRQPDADLVPWSTSRCRILDKNRRSHVLCASTSVCVCHKEGLRTRESPCVFVRETETGCIRHKWNVLVNLDGNPRH